MLAIEAVLPFLADGGKKIFITMHYKPDGDAIGATLGLYHYLRQKGHEPVVVSPSEVPEFLHWMPGMDKMYNFESEPKDCLKLLHHADYIFCLDFNQLHRVKNLEKPLQEAGAPKVLIDHHQFPDSEAFQYGVSRPEKSSTCEMVYDFIQLDKGLGFLNEEIMTCLYTGLMTDTGSFRFPVVTEAVHKMVADFKSRGLNHSIIHEKVFDVWSENRMRLLGYLLYKKMEIFKEEKVGIICLSKEEGKSFGCITGDTEGFVNYPLNILGIRCAIFLTERNDGIKLSFRSKGDFDVSAIAKEHFEGGGHFNAAGGRSSESLEKTLEKLKQILKIKTN